MANAEALERYTELPVPTTTEEAWRFTDLRGFDPDSYTQSPNGSVAEAPAQLLDLDVAGMAVVTEAGIEIERAPEGIRFEALTEDDPRLYSLVGWNEKFAAHNAAVWKHGLLVHVPKGVELEKPLYVRIAGSVDGGALFYRLLVVAEERSRFTLIEEYASSRPDLSAYSNAVAELFVGQAAKLEYVSIQNLSQETWHFASHHARVERDGELDWVAGGFGSKNGKIRIQNDLNGPGATSRVTGAYFADGSQHLDYDTFQEHIAPSTESDFAFKGALREQAHAVWRGMIRVEEDAQKTNAYQENRNLLLSDSAHADSIPGLEILANDVRCTHGATIGRVNREELFYLMTRGLPRPEAERLIVRGFFQDILDRIELEPVREALGDALEARIPQEL
ncbi:MAG TPA: Fe-S cluster assembly protein SufD [Gaiellaceae bacterium]|jgi:Fe-S cluster assembly protein SufD|nr:Fe-S cluster assembly protein SufD [Gaiellaceae bacterium]